MRCPSAPAAEPGWVIGQGRLRLQDHARLVRRRGHALGRPVLPAQGHEGAAADGDRVRSRSARASPTSGRGTRPGRFDCSGLVYAAYAAAGIHIARTTYQWQQDGPVVPLSRIQPGDLLFSPGSDGTPDNPGHVVMYLGGGQVIQAPTRGRTCRSTPPPDQRRRRHPAR